MQKHLELFEKKYPCCDYKQCKWNWQCMAVKDLNAKTLGHGMCFAPRCPKNWPEWHRKAHAKYLAERKNKDLK